MHVAIESEVDRQLTQEQQELAAEHYDFAMAAVNRFMKVKPIPRDDAESAAMLGLCHAAMQFDPKRGVKFRTFAQIRIRGAMLDAMRSISEHSRLDLASAKEDGAILPDTVSLSTPVLEKDSGVNCTLMDTLTDHMTTTREDIRDIDHLDHMDRLAEQLGLPGVALRLYYGDRCRQMRRIGKILGLSESRVSQMITNCLNEIRSCPSAYGF